MRDINQSTLQAKIENNDRIMITCNNCMHRGFVNLVALTRRLPMDTEMLAPLLTRLHSCPECKKAGRRAKNLAFTVMSGSVPSPPSGSANG